MIWSDFNFRQETPVWEPLLFRIVTIIRKFPFDNNQVGVGALRCLTKEKKHNRRWVRLLLRFSLFWLLLYLVMAVCCWCRWGICCCCFAWCCPLCHPKKLINQYQSYLAANPPGVVVQDGRVIHFKATDYENRMYKKIMKHVQRLWLLNFKLEVKCVWVIDRLVLLCQVDSVRR